MVKKMMGVTVACLGVRYRLPDNRADQADPFVCHPHPQRIGLRCGLLSSGSLNGV